MKFKLLLAAIIMASMSACAPSVLCPAYAIDDATEKKPLIVESEEM